MTDKTFGTKDPSTSYCEKKSAYLVALDGGAVHVIRQACGAYTLPGGEIVNGASHEEIILGACLDDTGYDVSVDDYVTDADLYDAQGTTHLTETYYCGSFIEKIAPQANTAVRHEKLSLGELEKLSEMQRYAVLQCADMMRADAHGSDDEDL